MVDFTLNGKSVSLDVAGDVPLLWAIRENAGLTGTQVRAAARPSAAPAWSHVNGQAVRACVTPAGSIAGKTVVTIEGLSGATADAVKSAWRAIDVAVQCGYCQSKARSCRRWQAALRASLTPLDGDIDTAMDGTYRCQLRRPYHAHLQQARHSRGNKRPKPWRYEMNQVSARRLSWPPRIFFGKPPPPAQRVCSSACAGSMTLSRRSGHLLAPNAFVKASPPRCQRRAARLGC